MPDNAVEDYGWSESGGPHSCDYITPEILSILEDLNPSKVLDLGAGNGALCSAMKSQSFEVVGVEPDSRGVQIAEEQNPGMRFYNLGVEDDPAVIIEQEGEVDCVVSTEVIEHLFAPHLLPKFAAQVLVDDGYLLITTPYHGYVKNLALSVLNKWDDHHTPLWHGGHIKFWSRATLTELLEQNGFRFVAFSGVGRAPYLWKSMVILAQKIRT